MVDVTALILVDATFHASTSSAAGLPRINNCFCNRLHGIAANFVKIRFCADAGSGTEMIYAGAGIICSNAGSE